MKKIEVTQKVKSNANEIWSVLRTGADLDKWLPVIATCRLTGEGEGAKRICTTTDGKSLMETILKVDDENHIFKYRIDEQNMMPVQNYAGTVTVLEEGAETKIHWLAEFELATEEAWPEVEKGLTDLLHLCINSLDEGVAV